MFLSAFSDTTGNIASTTEFGRVFAYWLRAITSHQYKTRNNLGEVLAVSNITVVQHIVTSKVEKIEEKYSKMVISPIVCVLIHFINLTDTLIRNLLIVDINLIK